MLAARPEQDLGEWSLRFRDYRSRVRRSLEMQRDRPKSTLQRTSNQGSPSQSSIPPYVSKDVTQSLDTSTHLGG